MMKQAESQLRISRLQEALRARSVHAALFILPIDVYYYAGTRQNSALWVPADADPVLFVRKSFSRAKEESPIADIRPFPSSKEFAGHFSDSCTTIGMTFDAVPVQQLNYYTKMLAGREFVDISMVHRELKSLKTPFELEQLRNSGARLAEAFRQVPGFIRAGMREIDLAAEFEYRLRKAGNEGYVRMRAFNQELYGGLAVSSGGASYGYFDGAVTGKGLSTAFPQGSSLEPIRENDPILLDYTGVFNGYITDMTRMFVIGSLDPELQRAFDTALEIQEAVRDGMRPGTICEELFLKAVSIADAAGFGSNFMGMPGEQARFVGHGVGLELDELPVLAQGFKVPLREGNVVAVEPKFVIPGKGVIGIENTFAVSASGGIKLTDIPDDIVFIEA